MVMTRWGTGILILRGTRPALALDVSSLACGLDRHSDASAEGEDGPMCAGRTRLEVDVAEVLFEPCVLGLGYKM